MSPSPSPVPPDAAAPPRARRRGPLVPGVVGPRREVPASIERPEYVGRPGPRPFTGSEVNDPETVERIRVASRLAAQALAEVGRPVAPGVTTHGLRRPAHQPLL